MSEINDTLDEIVKKSVDIFISYMDENYVESDRGLADLIKNYHKLGMYAAILTWVDVFNVYLKEIKGMHVVLEKPTPLLKLLQQLIKARHEQDQITVLVLIKEVMSWDDPRVPLDILEILTTAINESIIRVKRYKATQN